MTLLPVLKGTRSALEIDLLKVSWNWPLFEECPLWEGSSPSTPGTVERLVMDSSPHILGQSLGAGGRLGQGPHPLSAHSLSSHGSGEPFRWRTAPRQSVRTSWMHRNGRPAALGAPQVARLAGRQRWHPPHLPLSLSRVGIWRHQSQLSVQLTDEQDKRI